jgi:hypothetical protein
MIPAVRRSIDYALALLLAVFIGRVWLMAMKSGFWVDELVTVFVVRRPGDPSFAIAPQVPESLYYIFPKFFMRFLGSSEAIVRLPSALAAAGALVCIGRIAARLVHPQAAWFAVFACLAFSNFDYLAIDARPYALGIAAASASLLFLIRWLEAARWRDEAVFLAFAGALWYIHLFYWPFYLVYAAYAGAMLLRRDTPVSAKQISFGIAFLAAALAPAAATALRISGEAGAHTFNPQPTLRNLFYLLHVHVVLLALVGGLVLSKALHFRKAKGVSRTAWGLFLSWWLVCPLALFAYSHLSGNGVLISRYVSLMLPGIALTATAIAALFLPADWWKPAALAIGASALLFHGQWSVLWPVHDKDNWREIARAEHDLAGPDTPVLCPSPFIEAQWPVWNPGYRLPGFLYAHLTYYPLKGSLRLFPFTPSPESDAYLGSLSETELAPSGRFILYGSTWAVGKLDRWLAAQPQFRAWGKDSRSFGTLSVVVYRNALQGY